MTASAETWKSYAQLLTRLSPSISHILFAGPDGSFSRDLADNPKSQSMVVAITQLANIFGLETVAGHVETDAIRACAAQLGVDYGQGFFIGKPLALDDAIHDLPLYSCFATSTGLFDPALGKAAARGG